MYIATSNDIKLLKQKHKIIHTRITVKDRDFMSIAEVQGACTAVSYSVSSDSGIRRSAEITVIVKDDRYNASKDSLFWIDKIIKLEIGYESIITGEVTYYNLGHYLITENSFNYSPESKELSMSLVDLMSMFTGERGGFLTGKETKITIYSGYDIEEATEILDGDDEEAKSKLVKNKIIDAIKATVKGGTTGIQGWDKMNITYEDYEIPYDMEWGAGVSVYEILEELINLYTSYEFFFDVDGYFVCQKIPTGYGDPILLNDTILHDLIIEEPHKNNYSTVFNVTEVYGKCWDTDYFVDETVKNGNQYDCVLNIENFVYKQERYYGFTVPEGASLNDESPKIKINDLAVLDIVNDDGTPLKAGTLQENYSYVVRIGDLGKVNGNTGSESIAAFYQGQYQIHAISTLWNKKPSEEVQNEYKTKYNCLNMSFVVSPENPFAIDRIGDVVNKPIEDEVIWLDKDCLERAEYENWKTTVLTDTVSMQTIIIPWLDVNEKIEHTVDIKTDKTPQQYIIKSLSCDFMSGVMECELINFYEEAYNLPRE